MKSEENNDCAFTFFEIYYFAAMTESKGNERENIQLEKQVISFLFFINQTRIIYVLV
jgi:hypothetical protein